VRPAIIAWMSRATARRSAVGVGSQLADQIAILSFGEQLFKLRAQVFHSWDYAPAR